MPHIPRAFGSTSIRPELSTVPRRPRSVSSKPPAPYHGSSQGEGSMSRYQASREERQSMTSSLSVKNFEVDPSRVYQQLMGKEAQVDEHSGELVQPL